MYSGHEKVMTVGPDHDGVDRLQSILGQFQIVTDHDDGYLRPHLLISEATTAPSSKPKWYSITTASILSDISRRNPSPPLVAVTSRYPFSSKWSSWPGSRCMQSNVL